MTLRDALLEASTHIARRDAETLLAHALHRDRAWLLAHAEDELAPQDLESFRALTARRANHEPLQYITGTQEFFGLALRVTPDVLIPRPETEHLVEAALDWAHKQADANPNAKLQIADVGTGSGAIAIALGSVLEHASITAIDISPAALAIARENDETHRLSKRLRFVEGDLLTPVASERPFDIVISNPPYVALSEAPTLIPEVRDHEPSLALYAGPDGLEIYRRLIPQAYDLLRSGGLLALEIGFGQRESLSDLLSHWKDVHFLEDYASIPRVVLALHP
ncbi:MAG TPA: peptide chain release factor N(5)-glutamine methyltransferase [Candidatus Aquilonibacter sp.]|nr:peptide chain release factor N(5)-glutamine methyltransferase [Candidatus Aquilonibacter sp.]